MSTDLSSCGKPGRSWKQPLGVRTNSTPSSVVRTRGSASQSTCCWALDEDEVSAQPVVDARTQARESASTCRWLLRSTGAGTGLIRMFMGVDAIMRPYARKAWKGRTPVPTNDLWIAALVTEHGARLCTRDAHFGHFAQPDVV